jgi:PBP1b-binding outer membrane lipoprotein LpoB
MNADEQGFVAGTGVESQDLVNVADKMARSIVGIPQIANAPAPPTIVLQPVDNQTRFPINKDIFLTRIRAELNSKASGKMMFLARNQMEALEKERNLKREGAVTASADPAQQEFKGADYFLTGTLQGLSTRTAAGTSDYILYDFHLIDARTSAIVWEDHAEIKKQGLEDAAYR